tara:strand:- start:1 stop:126 length:126 start_codon:yes stop_codon:yes gene_type:complete
MAIIRSGVARRGSAALEQAAGQTKIMIEAAVLRSLWCGRPL